MRVLRIDQRDHIVSEGRVDCAKYGHDVSVETCWACDRLIRFNTDGKLELVRCEPERRCSEFVPALIV